MTQKNQSVQMVKIFLDILNSFSSKTNGWLDFFRQSLNQKNISQCRRLFNNSIFGCILWIAKSNSWKCQNERLVILSTLHVMSQSNYLGFFNQSLFFSTIGKAITRIFDKSISAPVDGKYRSATARLNSFYLICATYMRFKDQFDSVHNFKEISLKFLQF